MPLPLRKIRRLLKYAVCMFFLTTITVYIIGSRTKFDEIFEHRISKRSVDRPMRKKDWHNHTEIEVDRLRTGPGEQGKPYDLPPDHDANTRMQLLSANGFNALVSDYIALDRSLSDIRPPACRNKTYLEILPEVSVVIPFHDEHWSVLLRTFTTILKRSPPELLREIILVDDDSEKPFLKQPLEDYIQQHYPGKVKVVRTTKREGLIRARILGMQQAQGEVLIVLDAHSECLYNWLPPLLEPIALDYRTVVCPYVDIIDSNNFGYTLQDPGSRGAFDWTFNYKRLPLPNRDQLLAKGEAFESPVMAGGYFAISAKWFWELGGYDEGLEVWGAEQYELSFKLWQCGGRMLDAPCSHVGHIYRQFNPFGAVAGVTNYLTRNNKRVAEVWMDEFKEYIYMRNPNYEVTDAGNITRMLNVRKSLNCKPFSWFLENVLPDMQKIFPYAPRPHVGSGHMINIGDGQCIDTSNAARTMAPQLMPCGQPLRMGQEVLYTMQRKLRPWGTGKEDTCFLPVKNAAPSPLYMRRCDEEQKNVNEDWIYDAKSQQFIHTGSKLCLESATTSGDRRKSSDILINTCDQDKETQKWRFTKFNESKLQEMFPT